jgi:hypothetical protein
VIELDKRLNPMECRCEYVGIHRRLARRRYFILAASWIVIATYSISMTGCGGGNERLPVDGSVTLDGQPISKGQIIFLPMDGTSSPTAGAIIEDGRFSVPAEKGLMKGKFRVEISAMRATSQTDQSLNVASGQMEVVEKLESIVPPRYNRESALIVEVEEGAQNSFPFELKSK